MPKASLQFTSDSNSSREVWSKITDLAKRSRRRAAAVAFLNGDALEMLPLRSGDLLKIDMSDWRLIGGATNPHEIQKYYDEGVEIYSCTDLHAKVFTFDQMVVVGST